MARAATLHTQRTDPKNPIVIEVFKSCKDTADALGALMLALQNSSSDSILQKKERGEKKELNMG